MSKLKADQAAVSRKSPCPAQQPWEKQNSSWRRPHALCACPTHDQGLQPITEHLATGFSQSVLKFLGKLRGLFSRVVDKVKRKNEGNSSSSWEATFVSVQLFLQSTKAQPQSPRGALCCTVDAAIIVMWRNVSFSHVSPLMVSSLFVSLPLHNHISLSWNRLHKGRVMFS